MTMYNLFTINLRHIKFLVTIILSLLLSSYSFADKKFDKDLKKVSKDNGLIENNGKIYSINNISDKKNTILVVYSHGSHVDKKWINLSVSITELLK